MQPLRGLHGAALRARPARGRAVSRCCPRAPRGCVAARDARSAFPAARSAAAAASRSARRRGGLSGAPRVARRAQRGGCGAGAPLARPRLARLRRGRSRCASRGARQPPGDTTATQAPARPAGAVRPAPSASALRAALQGLAAVVWRGGGRVPPAAPGSGRRAPSRAPSSPASPALLAFLGRLRARLRRACHAAFAAPKRPQPAAAPEAHPTPRPPLKGRGRRVAPGLLFSFGRDILFARGTSPKLAFKLDHPQHVAAVSLSLTNIVFCIMTA